MSFSKIAKDLRSESGLSQMELSKRLGISAAAIGFLELGKHEPNATTIVAYSKFFNVTSDYLLELDNDFGANSHIKNTTHTYSADERHFIEKFRKIPRGMQEILSSTLDAMIKDTEEDKI